MTIIITLATFLRPIPYSYCSELQIIWEHWCHIQNALVASYYILLFDTRVPFWNVIPSKCCYFNYIFFLLRLNLVFELDSRSHNETHWTQNHWIKRSCDSWLIIDIIGEYMKPMWHFYEDGKRDRIKFSFRVIKP